jgi:hypothetical protein
VPRDTLPVAGSSLTPMICSIPWRRRGAHSSLCQNKRCSDNALKSQYDKDFIVNYSFNINDYVQKSDNEVYINMNLNRELSSLKIKKDRKSDIEYDYKKSNKYITVLDIPKDLKVSYLPENIDISNELFSGTIKYSLQDNQIVYEHTITLNFLTLNLDQQKEFNEFIKNIEKQYKEVVVLETK